jgi:four helix bundle protein
MALWKESQDFAELVVKTVGALPKDRGVEAIGLQLIRAAGSIAANIAEGYGRYSQAAYRNHLSIARGSAFEAESWLDLLIRTGHLEPVDGQTLLQKCAYVQSLITTRMKGLGEARGTYAREEGPSYEA